jgi:large repetitive protein
MQFVGRLDSATLNGSEQIFLPLTGPSGGWRDTTRNLVWDPTQANILPPVAPTAEAGNDQARVLTYGRGFGNPTNGLVQYLGGHSANKGSAGDVAAQRSYFNFILLAGIERRPEVEVDIPEDPIPAGNSVGVSATVTGGSPGYNYEWQSSCGGTFGQPSGLLATDGGTINTTFTAPPVLENTPCNIRFVITDSCERVSFGAEATEIEAVADLAVEKTAVDGDGAVADIVQNGESFTYTITVTNNGPGIAENTVVTDIFPAEGLTIDSVSPAPTSVVDNVYTWNFGDLASGAEQVITFEVTANQGALVALNEVTVTSDTPDPNLANNTSAVSTILINAGIAIEKIARPEIVPSRWRACHLRVPGPQRRRHPDLERGRRGQPDVHHHVGSLDGSERQWSARPTDRWVPDRGVALHL